MGVGRAGWGQTTAPVTAGGWVLTLWGRPGRAAVPFLLVRVEAGLPKTWKHQSERSLDSPVIRNGGKGRGLVWGDPVQGLLLGSCGALGKPLHHSELRCHGVYCIVMIRPHHSMEYHFLWGQVTANVMANQLVMVIDPRTSLSTDEKNLDTPFSSVLLRERLGKLLPSSGSQSSHLLRQSCKYHDWGESQLYVLSCPWNAVKGKTPLDEMRKDELHAKGPGKTYWGRVVWARSQRLDRSQQGRMQGFDGQLGQRTRQHPSAGSTTAISFLPIDSISISHIHSSCPQFSILRGC